MVSYLRPLEFFGLTLRYAKIQALSLLKKSHMTETSQCFTAHRTVFKWTSEL